MRNSLVLLLLFCFLMCFQTTILSATTDEDTKTADVTKRCV